MNSNFMHAPIQNRIYAWSFYPFQNLTEAFKQLDQDRDGVITIQYEHFLYLFLNLLVN